MKITDKMRLDELESSLGMSSDLDQGKMYWQLRQGPIRGEHYGRTARKAIDAAIKASRKRPK